MAEKDLTEKHRPRSLDGVLGQEHIVKSLRSIVKRKRKTHFLFTGMQGVGKTTVAKAFAYELYGDEWFGRFHQFNSSDERGIKTVRESIKSFSRFKGSRIVLLDEADNMTKDAQQALRGLMEENTDAIFILTGNNDFNIIPPIRSRCTTYRFKPINDLVIGQTILDICKKENIEIEVGTGSDLKTLVKNSRGSLRQALNDLESVINENNEITKESLEIIESINVMPEILRLAASGNFKEAKNQIQKQYILNSFSTDTIIDQMLLSIDEIDLLDDVEKIRVFSFLGDLEYRLKINCDPHAQLIDFIAKVWVVRHLPRQHA